MLDKLDITTLKAGDDPIKIFEAWYLEATQTEELPDGFSLATAEASGRVSNRYLNYKGIEDGKLIYVGNFNSQKAQHIQSNPHVAMNFFWKGLGKQVRIEGSATRMPSEICDKYYHERSELSRLASSLSNQSSSLSHYDEIKTNFALAREAIERGDTQNKHYIDISKRPETWGATGVSPTLIEFFVYGEHRLNLRYEFRLNHESGLWQTRWLAP